MIRTQSNSINSSKNTIVLKTDDRVFVVDSKGRRPIVLRDLETYIQQICSIRNITGLNPNLLATKAFAQLKNKNTMKEIDEQIVTCAADLAATHYMYPYIGTYIEVRDLHQNTPSDYLTVCEKLYNNINEDNDEPAPIITKEILDFVRENKDAINSAIVYDRDFKINFFGLRTLKKAYLKRVHGGKIIERPQHVYMRVAIEIHYRNNDINRVIETYDLMSQGKFTHATPTLYNAGTPYPQLSSCFLLGIADDSMESIAKTWKDSAIISKFAGGIGINGSNIRVNGAYIKSTQGKASGLRMLTVFNAVARYADQGGKRPGSIAFYIEPWHGDIFFFLDLKKNTGAETERARDLFLALAVNDLFMKRVEQNGSWSLMCPSKCPKIVGKYGTEFEEAYIAYENSGKYLKQIAARELFFKIMETQIETGVPYILFKDSVNYKSNQKNLGTINGSNLCVTGDTMILTDNGNIRIDTVVNQQVNVWNGYEYSQTVVKKTGENQKITKITFSNGSILRCTLYHKFYILINGSETEVRASELVVGDRIIDYKLPDESICSNVTVVSNEIQNNLEDTYCFNEPKRHMGIFNGVITGQCIEIVEYTAPDEYAVCFTADTMVNTDNGLKRIEDITDDNVLSVYQSDEVFVPEMKYTKSKLIPNGTKDIYLLETKNGMSVRTTANHPFLVNDSGNYVWRKAENLTTNDSIITYTNNVISHTYLTSFTNVGSELVYDLNVPITHNFVANGFVVHNCNLASIALPAFITVNNGVKEYNYPELYRVARVITRNLNNIIDFNYYPVPETRNSNMRHRPIGMGVQGLADVFAMLHLPFDSEIARDMNKKIFETIYFGALTESHIMAKESGPYSTFKGSPISEGSFQFNLWGMSDSETSGMWDWADLRQKIMTDGVRNSLTTACMPTASTSQILGWNECIEPYTENIYTRTTTAGDFFVINRHLMQDLMDLGLWNDDVIDMIKLENGSVRRIPNIPDDIKQIYRTAWEIPKKSMIEMSADRGRFIDQTQSFNIFIERPTFKVLASALMYGWKLGLKTGIYYLRSKPVSKANQFGIDIDRINKFKKILGDDTDNIDDLAPAKKDNTDKICVFKPKHLRKPEDCDLCSA